MYFIIKDLNGETSVAQRSDGSLQWYYLEEAVAQVRLYNWPAGSFQITGINTEGQVLAPEMLRDYEKDGKPEDSGEDADPELGYYLIVNFWDRPVPVLNREGKIRSFYLEDVVAYVLSNNLKTGHFQFGPFMTEYQDADRLETLYNLKKNEATREPKQ